MKKIRIAQATFENRLMPWQVPAFRAAVSMIAGFENNLYHNHSDKSSYLYRYPLIQYKSINEKPLLLYLEKGVDDAYHFFASYDKPIKLNGRVEELVLDQLNLYQINLNIWENPFKYQIKNWLPFDGESYEEYKLLPNPIERIEYLETRLTANLLSMAKGLDWEVEKRIKVRIDNNYSTFWISYKDTKMLGVNATFFCNISIPKYIGLGKGAGLGYGIVRQARERRDANE